MLIPGLESLLCVVLLAAGSLGLFALFAWTDTAAVRDSAQPQNQVTDDQDLSKSETVV